MSNHHIATAAFVKVSIGSPSGNRVAQLVQRGGLVPAGVDEAQLERLVDRGLIEAIELVDESESAGLAELPVESWNNDRIDEWAAAQEPPIVFVNPEDAEKAPTKKHRLAQIAVELEARKAQQ